MGKHVPKLKATNKTKEEIRRDFEEMVARRDKGRGLDWGEPPKTLDERVRKGPICGAQRKRGGGPCLQPAGWGTDHPGVGRCKRHSGNKQIIHGRYSSIIRPRIRDLLEKMDADPDPLNLLPEVKLLRALLIDYIERYDLMVDGLLEWKAAWRSDFTEALNDWREQARRALAEDPDAELEPMPDPRVHVALAGPQRILDITVASVLADRVGAMVDRIEKHKAQAGVSLETLNKILEQVGIELVHALRKEVDDERLRERVLATFERRWQTVQIDAPDVGPARGSEGYRAD